MKNMCYEMSYQNIVSENQTSVGPIVTKVATSATPAEPVSRTYTYRKIMKPMLERKRRARINRCLDELKELMVTALQSEGENVSKLEKADILELTVRHLHKLRRQERLASANPVINEDRFRAGYTHAANEVSRVLASIPGVDIQLGTKLMSHLGHTLNSLDKSKPLSIQTQSAVPMFQTTPPISPASSLSSGYSSNNSVSVIMTTQSASRIATPPVNLDYQMPLTPMSSRCSQISQTPSPRPEYRSTPTPNTDLGLLKVINLQQLQQQPPVKHIQIKSSSPAYWRPF